MATSKNPRKTKTTNRAKAKGTRPKASKRPASSPRARTKAKPLARAKPKPLARAKPTTGGSRPAPPTRFTPAQVRKIRAARKRGVLVDQLASEYACSPTTISAAARGRGAYAAI